MRMEDEEIKSELSELLEKDGEILSNMKGYYKGSITFSGFLIDPSSKRGLIFK